MANWWCYVDERPRSFCDKDDDGECVAVARQAALTALDRASGNYDTPFLGIIVGGAHPEALDKQLEIRFDRDMDKYREARRGGEQPDQVSEASVHKNQQLMELQGRMKERQDRG